MATLRALLSADDGPHSCALEHTDSTNPLPFSHLFDDKAATLTTLIEKYQEMVANDPTLEAQLATKSVASWIFYSNRIEFAALPTEGDTEHAITHADRTIQNQEERDTILTLRLLESTYSPATLSTEPPQSAVGFDSEKLKSWHRALFNDGSIRGVIGDFRSGMAYAKSLDGKQVLKYPHHEIVPSAMLKLGALIHSLLKRMGTYQDPIRRVAHLFAVAAFAHFHFLDIHPFGDGNGRIGRYLIKRLLDVVLPVPFGLFDDRDAYIGLLEERSSGPGRVMEGLMGMMLDNACKHYKGLLDYQGSVPDMFVCVLDSPTLKRRLRELKPAISLVEEGGIIKKFHGMEDGAEETFLVDGGRLKLLVKKFPSLIIDDI
ncbi:hypothetical protein HK104_003730 [Borealophlyctis nickersoniae]|nr:hypothetical protein HK104_003730 [Borealophlyctis nickersoniae]